MKINHKNPMREKAVTQRTTEKTQRATELRKH